MFVTRTAFLRCSPTSSFFRPNPSFQVARQIHQSPRARSRIGYGDRRPQYNRFSRAQQLYGLWKTSPTFRLGVGAAGAGAGTFYVYNLEDVPVSGRRRFNCIPPSVEQGTAQQMYQQMLQEFGHRVLPAWHPQTKMVQKVLDRLIPQSGLVDQEWEVHVIDDKSQMNAFVIPGGKVFVFSGILPLCDGEDGLAAVLGHEIAHNVAHHAAERMSQAFLGLGIVWIASYVYDVSGSIGQTLLDYAFLRPGSRKQEVSLSSEILSIPKC
ncbi:MAG: hypothetical protein M1830_006417 [Pleopsidium flavum]|nr:MAG: hypothetical protein M1830_006417 [Pleopsidium flavum]